MTSTNTGITNIEGLRGKRVSLGSTGSGTEVIGLRILEAAGIDPMSTAGIFGVPLDVAATYIILFTVYGAVLEYSGASRFFLDLSLAAFGRSRAGPGRTITAAGFLLGTVSGSGVATTVTLGGVGWPLLRRGPGVGLPGRRIDADILSALPPPSNGEAEVPQSWSGCSGLSIPAGDVRLGRHRSREATSS